jgi:hypothetical protein
VNIPAVAGSEGRKEQQPHAGASLRRKDSKMKDSTKTNQPKANQGSALNDPDTNKTVLLNATNGKPLGICRSLLLATALLGFLPTVQASEWGFNLIGKPSVEKTEHDELNEELPEVIQMTGAGKFNPEAGTASGGGAFAMFNAVDELDGPFGGPTFRGTWKVTDLTSWTPDGGPNPGLQGGTLQVRITLFFKVGLNKESKGFEFPGVGLTIICPFVDGQFVESEDAINVDILGLELFSTNPTGFTAFHVKQP